MPPAELEVLGAGGGDQVGVQDLEGVQELGSSVRSLCAQKMQAPREEKGGKEGALESDRLRRSFMKNAKKGRERSGGD